MPQTDYGVVSELEIEINRDGRYIVLQGNGAQPFRALLSYRAAHLLWDRLTRILYPHEAPTMTSSAGTAPLHTSDGQPLTNEIHTERAEGEQLRLSGKTAGGTWVLLLSEVSAHRLWAKLDITLYPVGWQGRESPDED